ncbi:MAG: uroporphyrinogen decarboxylase family protein [Anaerolineae bacterium]
MSESRERVRKALNHEEPDRVPLDLGSTGVTGIAASALAQLRRGLGLEERRVKVHEPFQMLGMVEDDVREALGVDVVGLEGDGTFFGFPLGDWKPFTLFDGTPVLVPGKFNTELNPDGSLYQYPLGDKRYAPSGRMPAGGFYHDAIERQEPFEAEDLDPEAWVADMAHVLTDEELRLLEDRGRDLWENTPYAIVASLPGASLGDIALVPATHAPHPVGIRSVEEWYMAAALYPDFVKEALELQCDIAMQNLPLLYEAYGDRIVALMISGTDFGAQHGPFISPKLYRSLYMPLHKRINDWIHEHTTWKTFYHSCGSMAALYDDFVEAGVDIVNPVQISAKGMDPRELKRRWGDKLVFWGGGVDTQGALPFGTPEDVAEQVAELVEIWRPGGGYVFNTVHNVQASIPQENLMALYETFMRVR